MNEGLENTMERLNSEITYLKKENRDMRDLMDKVKDDEKMPQLFFAIKIEQMQTYAFVNFEANRNTISYELFIQLNNINLKEKRVVL